MPKRSLVLNGFAGGLNKDSNLTDLSSEGRGKDELYESINLLNDYTGKAVATCPVNSNSSISAGSVDNTKDELLIYNNEYYQKTGLYKHGDDVEYSGKTTLTDPTALALAAAPGSNGTNGLSVAFDTSDNTNLFVGTSATGFAGTAEQAIFGDKDDEWDVFLYYGYGGPLSQHENGLVESIKWQLDGDDEAEGQWEETHVGGDGDWNLLTVTDGDWKVDVMDSNDDSLAGSSEGCWQNANLKNVDYHIDANYIDFRLVADSGDDYDPILAFRVGRQAVNENDSSPYGDSSLCGAALDVVNQNINIEFEVSQTLATNWADFQSLHIVLDSDDDDTIVGFDSGDNKYAREYSFTADELSAMGASGVGKHKIVISEDSFTKQGGKFVASAVNLIFIALEFSELTNLANAGYGSVFKLYELSFSPSDEEQSTWADNNYIFWQTSLTSTDDDKLESLPVKYTANSPFSTEDLGGNNLNFTVTKAASSPIHGNIYWQFADGTANSIGSKFLLCTVDSVSGVTPAGNNSPISWDDDNEVQFSFSDRPESSTFEIESGYPDDTTHINAEWETAAVVGRQVYIGSVKQPTDEEGSLDGSKILKSAIGKRYGFPDSQYIDLEFGGDNIKVLQSVGDRLFVFSEDKLTIVNVAQDVEILEAQFENMGVTYHKQVCKVGEGIAWVNTHGVHFFDGQQVKSLSDERMLSISWSSDDIIGYFPTRKMLLVWNDSDSKVYAFSFKSMSWAGEIDDDLITNIPETNVVSGNDGVTYYVNTNNAIKKIVEDTNGTPTITLTTGRIVCGDLSRRKRFKRLYITASNTAGTETAYYKIDGTGDFVSLGALTDGLNTLDINANGRDIQIKISGTANYNTEINDITLIYRDKAVR